MTDEAVRDAASRIVAAIDHLIVSVQDVATAIREVSQEPYQLPPALTRTVAKGKADFLSEFHDLSKLGAEPDLIGDELADQWTGLGTAAGSKDELA